MTALGYLLGARGVDACGVGKRAVAALLGSFAGYRRTGVTLFGARVYVTVEDRDGFEHYV